MTKHLVLLLAGTLAMPPALGQTSPPQNPTFDVASIRENTTATDGHTHIYRHPESGQFLAINASVRALLQFAFEMPDAQILNGPAWLGSKNFDIDAKADPAIDAWIHTLDSDHSKATKLKMLQALFADRFHLVWHQETRELPVYALVVEKHGSKVQPAKVDGTSIGMGNNHISDQGVPIAILADQLARVAGRPVVDKTGLSGRFDITLKWASDDQPTNADSAPSLFTAVQEQLGLKLESTKAPVPVLVIDHIEMPSPN